MIIIGIYLNIKRYNKNFKVIKLIFRENIDLQNIFSSCLFEATKPKFSCIQA